VQSPVSLVKAGDGDTDVMSYLCLQSPIPWIFPHRRSNEDCDDNHEHAAHSVGTTAYEAGPWPMTDLCTGPVKPEGRTS